MTPESQALGREPQTPADPADPFVPAEASLREVAAYYTWLGFTAFGGPAAHIALMQQDLVEQRRWLSQQRFLDTLGATQLVPGPNSTEMVIHVGYIKRGVLGMLVAGLCFILPAFCITVVIAYCYVALGTLPQTAAVFYGIQPVIVAIILMAAYKLGLAACRTPTMIGLALLGLLLTLFTPINTVWVIVAGGGLGVGLALAQRGRGTLSVWLLPLGVVGVGTAPAWGVVLHGLLPQAAQDRVVAPLGELGWFFLVVGGYADGQRLRAGELYASRIDPARLAHRAASPRCDCGGADDPRPGLHNRRLCGLHQSSPDRRRARCRRRLDRRISCSVCDLLALIHHCAAALTMDRAHPRVVLGECFFGWRECGGGR